MRKFTCPRCGGNDPNCGLCKGKVKVTEEEIQFADMVDETVLKALRKLKK
jgi:hypothetical protein